MSVSRNLSGVAHEGINAARRIPIFLFIVIFCFAVPLLIKSVNDYRSNHYATVVAVHNTKEALRLPALGLYINPPVVESWDQSTNREMLNTHDSYSITLQPFPEATSCSTSAIQVVQVELAGPAFTIVPVRDTISLAELRQEACSLAQTVPPPPTFHWNLVAKQDGTQLIALRLVGLDSHGNQVAGGEIEQAFVVYDSPSLLSIFAGLAVFFGLLGTTLQLAARKEKPA